MSIIPAGGELDFTSQAPLRSCGGSEETPKEDSQGIRPGVPNLPCINTSTQCNLVSGQAAGPDLHPKDDRTIKRWSKCTEPAIVGTQAVEKSSHTKAANTATLPGISGGVLETILCMEATLAEDEGLQRRLSELADDPPVAWGSVQPCGQGGGSVLPPRSGTVQISSSRADHFTLPREKSIMSSLSIDFVTPVDSCAHAKRAQTLVCGTRNQQFSTSDSEELPPSFSRGL